MKTHYLSVILAFPVAAVATTITQTASFSFSRPSEYLPVHQEGFNLAFQSFDSRLGLLQSVTLDAAVVLHAVTTEQNIFAQEWTWEPSFSLEIQVYFASREQDYSQMLIGAPITLGRSEVGTFSGDFDFSHSFQFRSVDGFIGSGLVPAFTARDALVAADAFGGTSYTGANTFTLTYVYASAATVPEGGFTLGFIALAAGVGLVAQRTVARPRSSRLPQDYSRSD